MFDACLFRSLNDTNTDVHFVECHWRANVEYSVNVLHCMGDIFWEEEIADGGLEIVGTIEIGTELSGGFIRVDEGSNGDFGIREEERDEMAALFAVCQGHKNDL